MEGNVCDIAGRTSPRDKGKDLTAQDQSHPLSSVSQIRSAISTFEKQGLGPRTESHAATLKELASSTATAAGLKHAAVLEQQLATLQRDLRAKQEAVEASRADLEYRQRLLRSAAGAARKEVLELRAYRDKAAAALAAAEQRIEDLTKDLAKHQLAGDGPQADDARSTMSGQAGSFTTEGPSEPATPQRQTQEGSAMSRGKATRDAFASTATSGTLPEASLLAKAADLKLLLQHASDMAAATAAESTMDADSVHGLDPLADAPLVQLQLNITELPGIDADVAARLAGLKAELAAESEAREALLQDFKAIEAKAAEKEDQCKQLESELAAAVEAASKAQQRVAVLESEVTALATQAEQAGVEVAEAQEEKDVLARQCARLRMQLEDTIESGPGGEQQRPPAPRQDLASMLEQRSAELERAEQRRLEAAAEMERLASLVDKQQDEVEDLKRALAEVEKQAEGEHGAHAALWDKLQEANERLFASATESVAARNEYERKLGLLDYSRQIAEGRCSELLQSLQRKEQLLLTARARMQGVHVLALASSVAALGQAEHARSALSALHHDMSHLARESLAVEQQLRCFASDEETISTQVSLDAEHASPAEVLSVARKPDPSLGFATPKSKTSGTEEISLSSCSSISFAQGIPAPEKVRGLEASSVPCLQRPRLHSAAVAARRWLHGQISPPRQYLQPHQQGAHSHTSCALLPLLQPTAPDGDLRPTPRLHIQQPSQEQEVLASSENPMLLLETPHGSQQGGNVWTVPWLPEMTTPGGLPQRQAASCPATPAGGMPPQLQAGVSLTAVQKTAGHHQSGVKRASGGAAVRRQLFQRVAALANSLESFRLQVETSLSRSQHTGGHASPGCASAVLATIEELQDDTCSWDTTASTVAPKQQQPDRASQNSQHGSGSSLQRSAVLGTSLRSDVQGLPSLPAMSRSTGGSTFAASSGSSVGHSTAASALPDLASMPPRLQKLAKAAFAADTKQHAADDKAPIEDNAKLQYGRVVRDCPCSESGFVETLTEDEFLMKTDKDKLTKPERKSQKPRRRQLIGSLLALPLVAVAVMAHCGLGHRAALAAAAVTHS